MRAAAVLARRAATGTLLLAALAALLLSVALRTDTVRVRRVLTGSMAPTVPAGSLVASRPVAPAAIATGDLVMYLPPAPFDADGTPVLHRVVAVERAEGDVLVRTRGDANAADDPWTLNASRSTVHRVAWSSRAAGTAAGLLARGGGSALLTGVVALVTVRVLALLWRPRRPTGRHRVESGAGDAA